MTDYAQFSPDGTSVLAYYGIDKSTWLLDPTGTIPDRKLSATIAERAGLGASRAIAGPASGRLARPGPRPAAFGVGRRRVATIGPWPTESP